nr:MAG TPA: hypothetical protein [Caudoviricetes sp.]
MLSLLFIFWFKSKSHCLILIISFFNTFFNKSIILIL